MKEDNSLTWPEAVVAIAFLALLAFFINGVFVAVADAQTLISKQGSVRTLPYPAYCTTNRCLRQEARYWVNDRRVLVYFCNDDAQPTILKTQQYGINQSVGYGPCKSSAIGTILLAANGCFDRTDKLQCENEVALQQETASQLRGAAKKWCRRNRNGRKRRKCFRDYWRVKRYGHYQGPNWRVR